MDKLKMHSPDLSQDNIAKIRELFPGCVTEARDKETGAVRLAVDFDQLRQELSDHIVEGSQERYRLDWPGKREALVTASAPIAKTLRPYPDDSVDYENTRNLFIEGDNLEALKLLQETYLGKIKLIYIDPPYNTGNDFVYDDDFAQGSEEFLRRSMQVDEDQNRLVANTEANGRFHSDWLSMILTRLKVARNILSEDGAIFISIDDGEVGNLRKVCDEIFGERNFIANIVWQKKQSPQSDAANFSAMHDHILVYAKKRRESRTDSDGWVRNLLARDDEQTSRYKNPDDDPRGPWASVDCTINKSASERPNLYYPITNPFTGEEISPGTERVWAFERETMRKLLEEKRLWWGKDGSNFPRVKRYLSEVQDGVVPSTWWTRDFAGDNQSSRRELRKYFPNGEGDFSTPKPTALLSRILEIGTQKDDLCMDFFAGSGSFQDAVFQVNARDGGCRQCISVQIDEPFDPSTGAYKSGYSTISVFAMERIRRAGKKILEGECHPDWNRDVGFRVLKVDTSNMKDVYYRPDELKQSDLLDMVDNVKEGRTAEDLLFQVLVDWGVNLTLPIRRETVQGKTVFFVDDNALVACFDRGVTEDLVKELAGHEPLRVVFRDNGFVSDAVKINVEQIFRQLSPTTDVKSI